MEINKLKGTILTLLLVCLLTISCTNRFHLNTTTCIEPSKEAYYYKLWNSKKLFLELIGIKNDQCSVFLISKEKGVFQYLGYTRYEPVYNKNSKCITHFYATYPLGEIYIFLKNDTLYRNKYFFCKADTSEFEIVNKSYVQKVKSLHDNVDFTEIESIYKINPIEFKAKTDSLCIFKKNITNNEAHL